jgi:hypothetical protein
MWLSQLAPLALNTTQRLLVSVAGYFQETTGHVVVVASWL